MEQGDTPASLEEEREREGGRKGGRKEEGRGRWREGERERERGREVEREEKGGRRKREGISKSHLKKPDISDINNVMEVHDDIMYREKCTLHAHEERLGNIFRETVKNRLPPRIEPRASDLSRQCSTT